MRFFEPSEEWLDWVADYAGDRIVVDVGCGDGHIVRALRDRNVKVLGIDPMWEHTAENRDLMNAVIPVEAEFVSLWDKLHNVVALFCRPCHSGFMERVLNRLRPDAEALYVSLPKNLGVDFSLEDWHAERVKCPPCEVETVWRLRRHQQRSHQ